MSTGRLLDADMQTVGRWLADAFRWWTSELAAMVPEGLRRASRRRVAMVRFSPDDGLVDADPGAGRDGRAAIVRVPRDYCLLRTIEQPALPPRDLAKLLALSADRLMPFAADALIAGRVVGPAPATGRIMVEAAGLPHARAAVLAETIARSRLRPIAVEVEQAPDDTRAPIDLLPMLRMQGLSAGRPGNARPWWAIVAFMALLNGAMAIWRDVASVDGLQQLVDAQQPALATAHAIETRIRHGQDGADQVRGLRLTREPLAILGRLGAAMPEGVWLQRLTIDGETVHLTGYRPANADVLRALRGAGLRDVRPATGQEMAPVPAGQPFDFTARLGAH